MAGMNFEIKYELRLCEVDGEVGYFHIWEQFSKPIPESLLRGGAPAGVISHAFGVVEFENGVRRVDPTQIKFCDETNAILKDFNEMKRINEGKGEGETNERLYFWPPVRKDHDAH